MDQARQPKKATLFVLLLALLALAATAYFLYEDEEDIKDLEMQKSALITRLADMIGEYNTIEAENDSLQVILNANKNEMVSMIDTIARMTQLKGVRLERFELSMQRFKEESNRLRITADSLRKANQTLKEERALALLSLAEERQLNDSLQAAVSVAAGLSIKNLSSTAVNVKRSGEHPTNSAWRAEKIRACFTISENPLAAKGIRKVYLRIINPELKILREDGSALADTSSMNLFYSASKSINYDGKALEVCLEYLNDDFEDGIYLIQLYVEGEKKAEQKLLLD